MDRDKSDFEIGSVNVGINPHEIQRALANCLGSIVEAKVAQDQAGKDQAAKWFGEDGLIPEAAEFQIGTCGELAIKVVIEPPGGYHGQMLEHDSVNGIGVTGIKLKRDM